MTPRGPVLHAFAAFLLSACGGDESSAPPADGPAADSPFAVAFLDAHNAVRAGTFPGVTVSPAPAPALPALTWSQAAADVAQAWADGCTYGHNPDRDADGVLRGENIAATAPAGRDDVTPGHVVGLWGGEWVDYDYAANACAAGEVCGHYTQLVWRETLRVGCAMASCSVRSPFGPSFPTWDFFVCDYEPPGNWIGQWPY
jgi:hypothetical protein